MDVLEFLLGESPVAMVAIFGAIGALALLIWLTGLLGSFSVVGPVTIGLVVLAAVLSVLAWRRRGKPDSH
jgi:hypothetical protein